MRYVISAAMEHFLDLPGPDPAAATQLPRTPYEAALVVGQWLGDGLGGCGLWPYHPSGLRVVVREVLHEIARGEVYWARNGWIAPSRGFADPYIRAFKAAGLARSTGLDETGYGGVVLTELGQTVIDGTFVAKESDLLDLLSAGGAR
jgi:hypothetical protein